MEIFLIILISLVLHSIVSILHYIEVYRMNKLSELRLRWLETPYLSDEQRARLIQYLIANTLKDMFNNYSKTVEQWDDDIKSYINYYEK